MFRNHERLFRRFLLSFDLALIYWAFQISLELRQNIAFWRGFSGWLPAWLEAPLSQLSPLENIAGYDLLLLALLPIFILILHLMKAQDFRCSLRVQTLRQLKIVGLMAALLISTIFLFKLTFIARSQVFLFALLSFLMLSLGRIGLMNLLAQLRRKRMDGHRVLIQGADSGALACGQALSSFHTWDLKLLGYLKGKEPPDPEAQPLFEQPLAEFLDHHPVDEVVFVLGEKPIDSELLDACHLRGVDVSLTLPKLPSWDGQFSVRSFDGYEQPLLSLRRTPLGDFSMTIKSLSDFLGALLMLLIFSPLMLFTAMAIKFGSKGPIFFKQERCGRNGRRFQMYKFRSMCQDAEAQRAQLEAFNEMDGHAFKIAKDPRVTSVGRFLRRSSIDELPQLFNVLMGDMSLIGPRPPLPSEVENYEAWQRRRLSMRPGLTGLWQVSGRNRLSFERWMELDLWYIDHWSLWLDLKILFKTIPAVFMGSGS